MPVIEQFKIKTYEALPPRLHELTKIYKASRKDSPNHAVARYHSNLLQPHIRTTDSYIKDSAHLTTKHNTFQSTDLLISFGSSPKMLKTTRYLRIVSLRPDRYLRSMEPTFPLPRNHGVGSAISKMSLWYRLIGRQSNKFPEPYKQHLLSYTIYDGERSWWTTAICICTG